MKILLSGSNGLVGSELKNDLTNKGHNVISLIRNKNHESNSSVYWDYENKILDLDNLNEIDCVIHLAGENISAKRWTEKQKKKILESRTQSTNFLIKSISKLERKPHSFICSSAIGYYGNRGEEVLIEESEKGTGFLSDVCQDWERCTLPAKEAGMRVVNLRFGVVLSEKGGALKKMLLPFKFGVGGKIGTGKQYISWISIEDTIRVIDFCLKNDKINGPINVVAPNPVTNYELTKSLGKILNRPTLFPLPAFAARLVLGEMADELLLASTRVEPAILLKYGFDFKHTALDKALDKII
jgi:uncharacterized protein